MTALTLGKKMGQTDGRTDGLTDRHQTDALCSALDAVQRNDQFILSEKNRIREAAGMNLPYVTY